METAAATTSTKTATEHLQKEVQNVLWIRNWQTLLRMR